MGSPSGEEPFSGDAEGNPTLPVPVVRDYDEDHPTRGKFAKFEYGGTV
jgi:hypothetical protein